MRKLVFILLLISTCSGGVGGEKKSSEIDGWDKIRFGMSKDDVMSSYQLDENERHRRRSEDGLGHEGIFLVLHEAKVDGVRSVGCYFTSQDKCCAVLVILETEDLNAIVSRLTERYDAPHIVRQVWPHTDDLHGKELPSKVGKNFYWISKQRSIRALNVSDHTWVEVKLLRSIPGYSGDAPANKILNGLCDTMCKSGAGNFVILMYFDYGLYKLGEDNRTQPKKPPL